MSMRPTAIAFFAALLWFAPGACTLRAQSGHDSGTAAALSPEEKANGWRLLFDGKDPSQWRAFSKPTFPTGRWKAEDGCLHLLPHKGSGGDLLSVDSFTDFELSWEWRISYGGNSGLKYLINEEHGAIGPEYQMIDDPHTDDGARGAKWITSSLYDVVPATNVVCKPLTEFNQSRLVVRGKHVEHWLNGQMTMTCELESEPMRAAVAASKFKNKPFFGVKVPGHILLQDHGAEVWFRNLKIRDLAAPKQ